LFLFL
jgi:hypothetical protein